MAIEIFNCMEQAAQVVVSMRRTGRKSDQYAVFISVGAAVAIKRNSEEYFGMLACVRRFVGVYDLSITVQAIADDLRAMLYVMPISCVQVV
jgi:hypothetical protein